MIAGIGIDIVEIGKMRAAVRRRDERFLRKLFTQQEIEYCHRCRDPAPRLAAKFAAKEAVLKAFKVGWTHGVKWTEVEVFVDEDGSPRVALQGILKHIAEERKVHNILLSLTHSGSYAIAYATLLI